MYGGGGGAGHADRPTVFYHGTSLEAILAIQESGFRVDLSGTNAGAALGPGVYITTTLEKALNYAKGKAGSPNPAAGGVFQLKVDLGHCYKVLDGSHGERKDWASRGYDSAWAAKGIIGVNEENCVSDPARIRITNIVLGNTGEAQRLGYEVRSGRLEISAAFVQEQARAQVAEMRRERNTQVQQARAEAAKTRRECEALQQGLAQAQTAAAEMRREREQAKTEADKATQEAKELR
eukprot:COSAG02_NODE_14327_length_1284_cov_1.107173_1_plen_235_part_10